MGVIVGAPGSRSGPQGQNSKMPIFRILSGNVSQGHKGKGR